MASMFSGLTSQITNQVRLKQINDLYSQVGWIVGSPAQSHAPAIAKN